ncbi:MAG: DoxX family protein [Bacteroidetes bacterium]|nr:DoxX family protein [Bacteroidota bacterium]
MQRFLDQFSRYFTGCLFIFSGLIKLNDPVGTQIKMEEYFEVFTHDFGSFFQHFIPWSLEIGMVMIVLELMLGVAILVLWRMKWTGWVLLGLMVFFTFLTFYSAYFNKVTDCGCFGDAIKLTPWQSFSKDVVLMVFVLHLFWYRHRSIPVLRTREGDFLIAGVMVVCTGVGIYAIRHLPFIDFRAYRIGHTIPEQMKPEEQPIIEYLFEKNGEKIKSQKFLAAEQGYHYLSSHVLNEDKTKPKITDYNVTSPAGEDKTTYTFEGNRLLIIIFNVNLASTKNIAALRLLTQQLEGKADCFILTASSEEEIEKFRHENQLAVPYYFADATVLKTIIRSNPGIALWKNGTVLGNWHYNDMPDAATVLTLLTQ